MGAASWYQERIYSMYKEYSNAKTLKVLGKYLQDSVRRTRYLPGGLGTDDALRERAGPVSLTCRGRRAFWW